MKLVSEFSITVAGLCLLTATETVRAVENDELELLLDAIARVESNSIPDAVGDTGRAIGIYQIHRSYWEDATKILGVDWNYGDARDPWKARQVVRAYLRHYGKGKSLIEMARIHNGGPRGDEKAITRDYARKIEAVLNGAARASCGGPPLPARAGHEVGSGASGSIISGA